MGLTLAPRIFSKLFKPILSHLRLQGRTVSIYIDDIHIQAGTASNCEKSFAAALQLLNSLGFYVNMDKSQRVPKTL